MCVGALMVCKTLDDLNTTFINVVQSLCCPYLHKQCRQSIEALIFSCEVSASFSMKTS